MQIPILIEPTEGGFRARAGEPFGVSAEGPTAQEAARRLESMLRDRLRAGTQLALIDLGNGSPSPSPPPLHLEPLPDDDWFFRTMREAIAENRKHEDEAAG
jgi:predicted RNase H-like HicB family nuclease